VQGANPVGILFARRHSRDESGAERACEGADLVLVSATVRRTGAGTGAMPDAPTHRAIFRELSGSGSAATLNGPPTGLNGSRLATRDGGANGFFV
jgi:hypothetical protein